MRNLKKILALALALVMSMSLMATANAFSDDDSITDTYKTAVTVLSELDVFQGYEDGSFQPQGPITRAEVAAIIYRIVTGDVEDTQVGIYADYNKFDDVKSTSWYAGYVNFCANAEYIKGYDAKTFGPNDPVTGYQALAMILRALGYDKNGEFTGTNWTIQTAAVGESQGILQNIKAGTLGANATREVVAEILFQAILVPKATYTPAFGYQTAINGKENTSIGEDTFGLEKVAGVVTANEYADLYDTNTLRAGKTELKMDGKSYTVDYTTTLEDIGEARAAYITGSTVLAIGDAGNTVFETGADTDIGTSSKFESVTGMERGDAEYFVNFDGGTTYEASDYRIGYVITKGNMASVMGSMNETQYEDANGGNFSDAKDEDGNTVRIYEKDIRRGAALTADDMDIIEMIFDDADLEGETIVIGEVYVGTQSNKDISDEISYNKFLDEYITTSENSVTVDGNENGNWLKVIDNDGDGVADIVLKTVYTATEIEDIDRDGNIELATLDLNLTDGDALNNVDGDTSVVSDDELNEGDIVYYAVIDGKAQTYLADMVTAEIDSVNRRTLVATTTDGDEYEESDVHNHTDDADYEDGVRNLTGGISYDLYLDKYGYLVAFTQTATSGDFTLLVDGWYNETRASDEYAVLAWDSEAQELVDTDVDDGADLFIDDGTDTQNNSWGNLEWFNGINDDSTRVGTIVASLSGDGTLTPVDDVFNKRTVRMIATNDDDDGNAVIPGRSYTEGTAYRTNYNVANPIAYNQRINDVNGDAIPVEVRALSTTVYYYVYGSGRNTVVNEYIGYANIPSLYENDLALVEDVYVVGTLTDRESGNLGETEYYTADVVVVEFTRSYRSDAEQVFVVDAPVVGTGVTIDNVEVIRADGTQDTVSIDMEASRLNAYLPALGNEYLTPGLYYMWETEDEGIYVIEMMDHEDIADANYTVGKVVTTRGTSNYDYTEIQAYSYLGNMIDDLNSILVAGETPEYRITDASQLYTLSYDTDDWRDSHGVVQHDYISDLDNVDGDIDAVLDERVDVSRTTSAGREFYDNDDQVWYNTNDVLVAYNNSGEIVYAISFANLHSDNTLNFAQFIWNNCKPAAEVDPYGDAVAAAEAALEDADDMTGLDPIVERDLRAALEMLGALTGLTAPQQAYVDKLEADIRTALAPFDDADDLAEARKDAIDAMKNTIWAGVVAEAETAGVTGLDKDTVLADNTLTIATTGLDSNYDTVAKAVEMWTIHVNETMDNVTDINEWVEDNCNINYGLVYGIGTKYVTAYKAAQDAKADQTAVDTALAGINLSALNVTVTDAAKSSNDVATAVETAVEAIVLDGINIEADVSVTSWDATTTLGSTAPATCNVKVTLTKNLATASDTYSITVYVTVNT